jgi:hypothetical protein
MVVRRTRVLLILLGVTAALTATGMAAGEALGRIAEARAEAERLEARIGRLREEAAGAARVGVDRDAIRAEVEARAARRYAAGTMNPYAFAMLAKARLSSLGVSVLRYQVVEGGTCPGVDFTATGSVRSFIAFLRGISEDGKLWIVPSLEIEVHPEGGSADARLRIGYATDDGAGR